MDPLYVHKFRAWLLHSPPAEWTIQHIRSLLIGALRQGPVPRHVAFVMDGNRRYAKDRRIETIEGHNLGFEALAKVLEVCYRAGVEVVTVYAFSIENFKRSKYEVDALMDMAKIKLSQMVEHGDLLDRYGACIRFLGNQELLRADVRQIIDEAIDRTKHNKKAIFNVCAPYTSRDEITNAVRLSVEEYSQLLSSPSHKRVFSETSITRNIRFRRLSTLREESNSREPTPEQAPTISASTASSSPDTEPQNHDRSSNASPFSSATTLTLPDEPLTPLPTESPLDTPDSSYPDPEKIDSSTLTSHMYTAGMPPLDLLIRTSGVERLSDFMLWQCHEDTSIVFTKCLWPQFDMWQFLPILVEWQWWRRKRGSGEALPLKQS